MVIQTNLTLYLLGASGCSQIIKYCLKMVNKFNYQLDDVPSSSLTLDYLHIAFQPPNFSTRWEKEGIWFAAPHLEHVYVTHYQLSLPCQIN